MHGGCSMAWLTRVQELGEDHHVRLRRKTGVRFLTKAKLSPLWMRDTGPKGLREIPFVMGPVYALSRVLGLLPLRYSPSYGAGRDLRAEQLGVSSLWLPFCGSTALVLIYASLFQVQHFLEVARSPRTSLKDYINEVPMLFNALIAVVCTGYSLMGSRRIARAWHSALIVLRHLDVLNRSQPSTSFRYRPIESWLFFFHVCLTVGMSIAAQILYFSAKDYLTKTTDSGALGLCRLVPLMVENQYVLSCLLLNRCYRGISRKLQDVVDQAAEDPVSMQPSPAPAGAPGSGKQRQTAWLLSWPSEAPRAVRTVPQVLEQLRFLHGEVSRLLGDVNAHFGIQLLFKLVQTRIQLITDSYTIASNNSGEGGTLAFYIQEVGVLFYRLFVAVYSSEAVLAQDQSLARLLCMIDPTSWDHESNHQLVLLRRQVLSLRARLHTCAVFSLNYDFLVTVFASTTTYLIMLIQFQQPNLSRKNSTDTSTGTTASLQSTASTEIMLP